MYTYTTTIDPVLKFNESLWLFCQIYQSKGKSRMDNAETQAKWVTRYRQIRNNVTQKTMRKWANDGLTNQD